MLTIVSICLVYSHHSSLHALVHPLFLSLLNLNIQITKKQIDVKIGVKMMYV